MMNKGSKNILYVFCAIATSLVWCLIMPVLGFGSEQIDDLTDEPEPISYYGYVSEVHSESGVNLSYESIGDGQVGLITDKSYYEEYGLFGANALPANGSVFLGWVSRELVYEEDDTTFAPYYPARDMEYFAVFCSQSDEPKDYREEAVYRTGLYLGLFDEETEEDSVEDNTTEEIQKSVDEELTVEEGTKNDIENLNSEAMPATTCEEIGYEESMKTVVEAAEDPDDATEDSLGKINGNEESTEYENDDIKVEDEPEIVSGSSVFEEVEENDEDDSEETEVEPAHAVEDTEDFIELTEGGLKKCNLICVDTSSDDVISEVIEAPALPGSDIEIPPSVGENYEVESVGVFSYVRAEDLIVPNDICLRNDSEMYVDVDSETLTASIKSDLPEDLTVICFMAPLQTGPVRQITVPINTKVDVDASPFIYVVLCISLYVILDIVRKRTFSDREKKI